MDKKEIETNIILYLMNCQPRIKSLVKPFKTIKEDLFKKEDRVFHDEIEKQYKEVIKWTIIKEVLENVQASTEDVLIVLESLSSLDEYLKL